MRVIDADALINEFDQTFLGNNPRGVIRATIENAPTIEPELIRCKDCRWGREACGNIECSADFNLPPEYHGYDWFCPNGERREQYEER